MQHCVVCVVLLVRKHILTCSHGGEHAGPLLIQNKSPVFVVSSRKQGRRWSNFIRNKRGDTFQCKELVKGIWFWKWKNMWKWTQKEVTHTHSVCVLTPGAGGQPAACAGTAPASARWGRSAARRGRGPARTRCGAGSRSAAARGDSDAPSRGTRKSTLGEGTDRWRKRGNKERELVLSRLCTRFEKGGQSGENSHELNRHTSDQLFHILHLQIAQMCHLL